MKSKEFARFVFLAVPAIFLGGCVTPKVWESGQFARYHEPASPVDVRLFYSDRAKDVLVDYVEIRDNDAKSHRRAFWLEPNARLLEQRRRPHFVSLKAEQDLMPIPLLLPAATAHSPSSDEALYAQVSPDGRTFTMYSASKEIGKYDLPVYRDATGRVKQVLLTPLAVTADLGIVGSVVGVIIVYAYAGSFW